MTAHAVGEVLKGIGTIAGPVVIAAGVAGGAIGAVYVWKQAPSFLEELLEPFKARTRSLRMKEYIASESTMTFDDWLEVRNSWRFRIFRTYSEEDYDRGFRTTSKIGQPPARYTN